MEEYLKEVYWIIVERLIKCSVFRSLAFKEIVGVVAINAIIIIIMIALFIIIMNDLTMNYYDFFNF